MKKRLLSLALALALCLGLTVPALAADVSGLDAATAAAYARVLEEQISKHGIRTSEAGKGLVCAELEDMDGDGTPELIILNAAGEACLDIGVWRMQSGKAVRTASEWTTNYIYDGKIAFAHKNGEVRLFCDNNMSRGSLFYRSYGRELFYIDAGGTRYDYGVGYIDEIESEDEEFPPEKDLSNIPYDKSWAVDSTPLLTCSYYWEFGKEDAVRNLESALKKKASSGLTTTTPAPGTFGPYSIYVDGWAKYFIDFESAKVERKTVKVRTVGMGGELRDYENVDAILIKVAPLSRVSTRLIDDPDGLYADFAEYAGCDGAYGWSADVDGSDKFTVYARGSAEFWLYSGAIERSITGKDECIDLDWTMDSAGNYVQAFVLLESGTGTTAPSEPTAPSFTDVPAGEYYAAPVSWAISKGITNGTSTTTFSPDDKCTEAQILTFLWRASGKPAPSGQRPAWVDAAYQDAVLWASNKGMIDLAGFNPGKPCTRANAVKFIWQAQGSPSPSAASTFTDVAKGADYAAAVSWAVEENVTKGTSTTTFSPGDTCTRGQIVTFLHRAMG